MTGDKIHGSISSGVNCVDVVGADEPQRCCLCHAFVSFEVSSHIVAVSSVPFCPAVPGGERTHLVESVSIPCLGNKFDISKDWVKGKSLQKRRLVHWRAIFVTAQDRCKVETESVYPVSVYPVTQAVQNHLADDGMVTVKRVAASAEIIIISFWRQQVINVVIKSFK